MSLPGGGKISQVKQTQLLFLNVCGHFALRPGHTPTVSALLLLGGGGQLCSLPRSRSPGCQQRAICVGRSCLPSLASPQELRKHCASALLLFANFPPLFVILQANPRRRVFVIYRNSISQRGFRMPSGGSGGER